MSSKSYPPPTKLNRPAEDSFEEDTLSVASAHRATYERRVADGARLMQQRRVVIAGLARNLAEILPQTIKRIESLGKQFADYHVVIYENDSTDRTSEILQSWANDNLVGRWGNPDDVSGAVVFLASNESSFITGSDIKVEGGWLAARARAGEEYILTD